MSSKIPELRTDEELEAFLEQDLSDYITPENFKPARFEFLPKTRQVNLRFSEALLDAVRERARERGFPASATSAKRSRGRSTTAVETGDARDTQKIVLFRMNVLRTSVTTDSAPYS